METRCPTIAGIPGQPHLWDSPDYGRRLFCGYPGPTDADSITHQTTAIMADLVRGDLTLDWFRSLALSIAGTGKEREQLDRIFAWVQSKVTYEHDHSGPWTVAPDLNNVLTGPAELVTADNPVDDCDGFSMLTAALALAVGIPASFKTIAADPTAPNSFSHVYVMAYTKDGPYPLDASNGPAPNWEYPKATRSHVWPPILGKKTNLEPVGKSPMLRSLAGFADSSLSIPTFGDSSSTDNSGGGIDWNSIIDSAFTASAPILKAQFGTPQLAPGTFYSTSPTGATTMYAVPKGQTNLSIPTVSGSTSPTMIFAIIAILGIVLISKK